MARPLFAITAGYAALVVVSAATFTGAYFALGTNAAFEEASFQISPFMAACGIGAGSIGGLAGGLVCRWIASHLNVGRVLAGVTFVLTLASGVPMLMRQPPQEGGRVDIERVDAMTRAFHPRWFTLLFPLGQAAGVWLIAARGSRAPLD